MTGRREVGGNKEGRKRAGRREQGPETDLDLGHHMVARLLRLVRVKP